MENKNIRRNIRESYNKWKSSPNADSYCMSGANPTKEQKERIDAATREEVEYLYDIELNVEMLIKELTGAL